jgi:hypothetical protein
MKLIERQKLICEKYGSSFCLPPEVHIIGIAKNVRGGVEPIHGLRHPIFEDTSGWYVWAGEYSDDPNFFEPLHILHLRDWNPKILEYLGLEPGWRFLIDSNGYEDVWFDENLLSI